ncbi:MAG: alpha/beta hydrolase [Gloeobacteraceae cyanobacterium ES-bin-316]|nr:alpha/beta hydrolase [Ferruginibacter sp.]
MKSYDSHLMLYAALLFTASLSCKSKTANPYLSKENNRIAGTDETYRPPLPNPRALFIDDAGKGDTPVVFVHSFAGSTLHWKAQLAELRKTRRAIAFDLRAHGESPMAFDKNYSIESFASDIATVADSLKLNKFILVGHGLGSLAAVAYTAKSPGKVHALMLISTPVKTAPSEVTKIMATLESENYDTVMATYMHQLLTDANNQTRSLLNEGLLKLSKPGILKMMRAGLNYDPEPDLKKYTGPVLILDNTPEIKPGSLQQLFPRLDFQSIDGASHWIQLDKPSQFNALLQNFLNRISRNN